MNHQTATKERTMSKTQLNSEQKLDALKFISQTQRYLHEQRQKHELKAFFTTTTLFVLIAAARYSSKGIIPTPLPMHLAIIIPVILGLIAFVSTLYLNGIHKANLINKGFAHKAEDHIREILKENGKEIPAPEDAEKQQAITSMWQPVLIWILAIAATFLVTNPY